MQNNPELRKTMRLGCVRVLLAATCCAPLGMAWAEHGDGHHHGTVVPASQAPAVAPVDGALPHGIKVSDARIRLPLPGQTTAVVYLTLVNGTGAELSLNGVEIPGSGSAELHQHVHEDGMMRMRKVNRVLIPAGKVLKLAPGGYHIMVLDMATLPADASLQRAYPVTLIFENGERITANAWPVH